MVFFLPFPALLLYSVAQHKTFYCTHCAESSRFHIVSLHVQNYSASSFLLIVKHIVPYIPTSETRFDLGNSHTWRYW